MIVSKKNYNSHEMIKLVSIALGRKKVQLVHLF